MGNAQTPPKDGTYEVYLHDGAVKRVENYKAGKLNGTTKEYDSKGELLTEYDFSDGKHTFTKNYCFQKNGEKYLCLETIFDDNEKIKFMKSYNSNGSVIGETEYFAGNKAREKTFNDDGTLHYDITYQDITMIDRLAYWPNGKLMSRDVVSQDGTVLVVEGYDQQGILISRKENKIKPIQLNNG